MTRAGPPPRLPQLNECPVKRISAGAAHAEKSEIFQTNGMAGASDKI
jgi:hypothetical protein